jgi:hypothetical protein
MLIRDSVDIADSNGRTSFGAIIASFDTCRGLLEHASVNQAR